MSLETLLSKYKKYELNYDEINKVAIFNRPISVEKFLNFKFELIKSGIYYENILVINKRKERMNIL